MENFKNLGTEPTLLEKKNGYFSVCLLEVKEPVWFNVPYHDLIEFIQIMLLSSKPVGIYSFNED